MTILILIVLCAIVWHWAIDGILAPSKRWNVLLSLFRLRDELRGFKMEMGSQFDDHEYQVMESLINNGIRAAKYLDIEALIRIESEFKKRPDLAKKSEERWKIVYRCKHEKAQKIMRRYTKSCIEMVFWNHAGWIIYLFPIICAFAAKSYVEKHIRNLLSIPSVSMDKMMPQVAAESGA